MSNYDILEDGEYYVFSKEEGEVIRIGYLYTSWCRSPCITHLRFCPVNIGKPLPLVISGNSQPDEGQIKAFKFDSRNIRLIDNIYNRALSWLNQMQRELLEYPQLDETTGCKIAVIIVKKGILL